VRFQRKTLVKIHLIAAARPNFMKVAPLYHALAATNWCEALVIHTGQHYDVNMSDVFFHDLRLPKPAYHLGVGSGSHAEQTGGVMIAYEKVCMSDRPDWIVVVGDVNSTVACSLVGTKLWIPVVHLEAGLRSRDRRMPEEINRLVTDSIADLLWTPSADADENLRAEGVPEDRIELIGNVMIDSFEMMRSRIEKSMARKDLGLDQGSYTLVTLHRPSNVDQPETLRPIVEQLLKAAARLPLAFVAHPRTLKNLRQFGLLDRLQSDGRVKLLEPLPYVDFMNVATGAALVITDSGGLQEETTYLNIPCLTMRENTERPITLTQGTNRLVNVEALDMQVSEVLAGNWKRGVCPPLWDGRAAVRAVASLARRLGMKSAAAAMSSEGGL
jgi:UDP-N-acetylglucosamine 2-epimerase (non-hydrolysing)